MRDHRLLIGGLAALLFAWTMNADEGVSPCNFMNLGCRYVKMMAFGMENGRIFIPTEISELGSYRSCPKQMQIKFRAFAGFEPATMGFTSILMPIPLGPAVTRQQEADCRARSRMELFQTTERY